MFMAVIEGYDIVLAFEDTEDKAKEKAVSEKKRLCKDDLSEWTWNNVSEYYGASCIEVSNGSVVNL